MSSIGDWWRRLTGREEVRTAPPPPSTSPRPRPRPQPSKARPGTPPPGLAIDETPPAKPPGNVGAAGFDPYSSDAGYQKPHSWERVDHD
jgi:hypothetical protein